MLAHLMLVVLPFAAGLSVHRSSIGLPVFDASKPSNELQQRQNQPPPDAVCIPPCTAGGCDVCSAGGSLGRRDLGLPPLGGDLALESHSFQNTTARDGDLHKRLFTFKAGSTDPSDYAGNKRPTYNQLETYLRAALNGDDKENFGGRQGLMYAREKDERAVSKQREFKDKPFQILTDGVYGCTVLVLVSQRAVWMTHLWEIYSSGMAANGLGADEFGDPAFADRVIKFMKGENVDVSQPSFAPIQPGPYIKPSGPGIKWNLYNSLQRDQTQLFIFTPLRPPNWNEFMTPVAVENINQPKHYGEDGEVVFAIYEILGHVPQITIVPYTRLNRNNPEEDAMIKTSLRGTVTFQYDPNSNGNGLKAWRLFLEDRYYSKNITTW